MSEENVETLQAVADAFNRRDLKALSALLTPDVQIVPIRAALEGDTAYTGPDAAAEWFAAVDQSWEGLTTEIREFLDQGDCVLGFGRVRGRGRESAVDT